MKDDELAKTEEERCTYQWHTPGYVQGPGDYKTLPGKCSYKMRVGNLCLKHALDEIDRIEVLEK